MLFSDIFITFLKTQVLSSDENNVFIRRNSRLVNKSAHPLFIIIGYTLIHGHLICIYLKINKNATVVCTCYQPFFSQFSIMMCQSHFEVFFRPKNTKITNKTNRKLFFYNLEKHLSFGSENIAFPPP